MFILIYVAHGLQKIDFQTYTFIDYRDSNFLYSYIQIIPQSRFILSYPIYTKIKFRHTFFDYRHSNFLFPKDSGPGVRAPAAEGVRDESLHENGGIGGGAKLTQKKNDWKFFDEI